MSLYFLALDPNATASRPGYGWFCPLLCPFVCLCVALHREERSSRIRCPCKDSAAGEVTLNRTRSRASASAGANRAAAKLSIEVRHTSASSAEDMQHHRRDTGRPHLAPNSRSLRQRNRAQLVPSLTAAGPSSSWLHKLPRHCSRDTTPFVPAEPNLLTSFLNLVHLRRNSSFFHLPHLKPHLLQY